MKIFIAESKHGEMEGAYKIKATVEILVELMQRMTDEERMDVMSEFCRHCGCTDPRCNCWNDE